MTTQYIIRENKGTFYYRDSEHKTLHREDGPAAEWSDGDKFWYQFGKLHGEDGPAIEYANGKREWYLQGAKFGETEHQKLTGKVPTISIEGKSFTLEELKELVRNHLK